MKRSIRTIVTSRFCTLLIFCFACTTEEAPVSGATLIVHHEEETSIYLNQPQIIGDPIKVVEKVATKNHHTFHFELDKPSYYAIVSPQRINLLLQPGDSLILDLTHGQANFQGNGSISNREIYLFDSLLEIDVVEKGNLIEGLNTLSPEEYLNLIYDRNEALMSAFKNTLGSEPSHWANAYRNVVIDYLTALRLQQYIVSRDEQDTEMLTSSVAALYPFAEEVLYFPGFFDQLSMIATYLEVVLPLQRQEIYDPTGADVITGILDFEKDTLLRQAMLASALEQALATHEIDLYEKFEKEIHKTLTLEGLKVTIDDMYALAKEKSQAENGLLTRAYDDEYDINEALDEILAQNKGKVIYLDIWATWCRPCIEEFKISKDFKANFDDTEIIYVYACAQSKNKQAWKGIINQYELNGTHLFISDDQYDDFIERYPVGYFPSYYIIDQDGKTINKQANLSPSNPETTNLIKSLLK
jgi:thiol-disulfide isomerase/thioredoxin